MDVIGSVHRGSIGYVSLMPKKESVSGKQISRYSEKKSYFDDTYQNFCLKETRTHKVPLYVLTDIVRMMVDHSLYMLYSAKHINGNRYDNVRIMY